MNFELPEATGALSKFLAASRSDDGAALNLKKKELFSNISTQTSQ